jgi:hypothetical protein
MRLCNTFLGANDCILAGHWGNGTAVRAGAPAQVGRSSAWAGAFRVASPAASPPKRSVIRLDTMCTAIDIDRARQRMRDAPARATRSSPSENLLGVTSSSGATLEAPGSGGASPYLRRGSHSDRLCYNRPLAISTIHRSRSVIAGRPRFEQRGARAH